MHQRNVGARILKGDRSVDHAHIFGMSPAETPKQLANACGPVIYAFRLKDGAVKIGYTTNIAERAHNLGCGLSALLAIKPGTREDEAAIHATLVDHRKRGHEYYYPTPAVMAVVNEMRATFGMEPVAA